MHGSRASAAANATPPPSSGIGQSPDRGRIRKFFQMFIRAARLKDIVLRGLLPSSELRDERTMPFAAFRKTEPLGQGSCARRRAMLAAQQASQVWRGLRESGYPAVSAAALTVTTLDGAIRPSLAGCTDG
jgi:hypothetical protein